MADGVMLRIVMCAAKFLLRADYMEESDKCSAGMA